MRVFHFFFSLLFVSLCLVSTNVYAQQPYAASPLAADAKTAADVSTEAWTLYYGGPDKEAYHLRDVLGAKIDAQPPGGTIHFALYYFRDPILADKLIAAHNRGVEVTLALEVNPRTKGANDDLIESLQAAGLSENIYLNAFRIFPLRSRLHSKVYAFSHPVKNVLIGSYNPSGSNDADDPLGVQDRGHNVLYQSYDEELVEQLVNYVESFGEVVSGTSKARSRDITAQSAAGTLYSFPRREKNIGVETISNASKEAKVTGAISHMKRHPMVKALGKAAERGVEVNLIVHETERRVPQSVVDYLRTAGVNIQRYKGGEDYPMHAKFLLLEDAGQKTTWLGSYNWNSGSRKRNGEVLLESPDEKLYDALVDRFEYIASEIKE